MTDTAATEEFFSFTAAESKTASAAYDPSLDVIPGEAKNHFSSIDHIDMHVVVESNDNNDDDIQNFRSSNDKHSIIDSFKQIIAETLTFSEDSLELIADRVGGIMTY